ncbi:arsenate reductase (glutaredoxin) [Undibacterium baiyunense]|jgi:arsenate reductase|uniref:Arsenate reductase n=1 Tax=Undibacterium baiyunense TaxID=2828731 RepID=A0A941DGM1_9BURK|nr:arsenate reductase (glutaredoxin) [Undibacterium baiyunense]MBR7747731.1 arsenate reductase (glutaredoxin) [Undibacterium baiyunense]
MTITIYHNPRCGTSRNTLALIRNSGDEPVVIEYLKQVPSKQELQQILAAMSFSARQLMREKESVYQELGLADDKWSEDALVDVMLANPILINRPIVVTPLGTKLCRPSELVLEILPSAQRGEFRKEDGELVIGADGKRV